MSDSGEPPRESNPNTPTLRAAPVTPILGEQRGELVGPYTLLDILGEGGFGTVWLAERREPMVQRVAIKIIKPGMDSRDVVARFEQERQALALMDHPNVAKVFDAGATRLGRPYFVMEYVQGEPITAFCDRNRYPIRKRLEMFISVCEAVQHAHIKGIIHRDIKPSNVLVELVDGSPLVKVIDFGIAKAITGPHSSNVTFTQQGAVIGTPEYMSPEQVAGEADIDTRADVYSLGAMLYELLTGELPFDSRALRRAAIAEIQRIICEETPPKPSTRLISVDKERGTSIAHSRSAERQRLTSELRRELDWIPLMALRKERDRRYSSASALAEDVRRYLEGRPLLAAPDSQTYLMRKFVRRNKGPVIAVLVVFAVLTAGVIVSSVLLSRAQRAERKLASQLTETQKAQAEAVRKGEEKAVVAAFQAGMLRNIDPEAAGHELVDDIRSRLVKYIDKFDLAPEERDRRVASVTSNLAALDRSDVASAFINRLMITPAGKAVEEDLSEMPEVAFELRESLGASSSALGLHSLAASFYKTNVETAEKLWGPESPDTVGARHRLATALGDNGLAAEAEPLLRFVLQSTVGQKGPDHEDAIKARANLASALFAQGNYSDARLEMEAVLAARVRTSGPDAEETLDAEVQLAICLEKFGEPARSLQTYRRVLAAQERVLGPLHPKTIRIRSNLAAALSDSGAVEEAERLQREVLQVLIDRLGASHSDAIDEAKSLAGILRKAGKTDQAVAIYNSLLEQQSDYLRPGSDTHVETLRNLGATLREAGRLEEAEPWLRRALSESAEFRGTKDPKTLESMNSLAVFLFASGKLEEGEALAARVYQIRLENKASNMAQLLNAANTLAAVYFKQKRYADSERLLLETLAIAEPALDRGQEQVRVTATNLKSLYTEWHKADPNGGHDEKARTWEQRLSELETTNVGVGEPEGKKKQ